MKKERAIKILETIKRGGLRCRWCGVSVFKVKPFENGELFIKNYRVYEAFTGCDYVEKYCECRDCCQLSNKEVEALLDKRGGPYVD